MNVKRFAMGAFGAAFRPARDQVLRLRYEQLKIAFGIDSHLTIPERVKLFDISKNANTVCEIGSYIGASACCFGAALKEQGFGKVICIDTWQNDAMSEGNRDTWAEFQVNTHEYDAHISRVRGYSTEVVESVREYADHLDVLFIDGDHSYGGVNADWQAYRGLLKPGSTVIFHDYGWADGVKRVVHEDVLPYVKNHDSLPNMWWGMLSAN